MLVRVTGCILRQKRTCISVFNLRKWTDSCVILTCSESCVGCSSPAAPHWRLIAVFAVSVWLLGHRVDDRREDVQHEGHGRHQARHEKNCGRAGAPLPQKPRAERRSGGGVWRELSRHVAWQRQGRPETAFTCLGRRTERGGGQHEERWPSKRDTLTQGRLWRFADGPPTDECAISIFELFVVFIDIVHAAEPKKVPVPDCLEC